MAKNISLIVATRGRSKEIRRLLDTLAAQTYKDFEVIVVDQNKDDRVTEVLDYNHGLDLRHIRSDTSGHAAANNVGLRVCKGNIVGFPDDDCWYPADLLSRIVGMLETHPEWDGVSGCEAPISPNQKNYRFDKDSGFITLNNIWHRHISFTVFYRREAVVDLFFDEKLGPGANTIWGACEETDYLLRMMRRGAHVYYDRSLMVNHPDWGQGPYNYAAIRKAVRYGLGMGRVLYFYDFSPLVKLKFLVRPLLGGAYTLVRGRPGKAVYHWASFYGRTTGMLLSAIQS